MRLLPPAETPEWDAILMTAWRKVMILHHLKIRVTRKLPVRLETTPPPMMSFRSSGNIVTPLWPSSWWGSVRPRVTKEIAKFSALDKVTWKWLTERQLGGWTRDKLQDGAVLWFGILIDCFMAFLIIALFGHLVLFERKLYCARSA